MKKFLCLAVLCLAALAGCEADVRLVVYGEYRNPSVQYWQKEAQSYFAGQNDVVLIVGHGNTVNGEWHIHNELTGRSEAVEYAVFRARRNWPDKRIVLICCNPDGLNFDFPGVSYAKKNVWMFPDSMLEPGKTLDEIFKDDAAGSFDEFIHNPF